jgi:hypothetical protein
MDVYSDNGLRRAHEQWLQPPIEYDDNRFKYHIKVWWRKTPEIEQKLKSRFTEYDLKEYKDDDGDDIIELDISEEGDIDYDDFEDIREFIAEMGNGEYERDSHDTFFEVIEPDYEED